MQIREAVESDIPFVLELLKSMDGESSLDFCRAAEIWNRIGQYPYYKVLVVEAEEKIIGTFSLIIIDNIGHRGAKLAVVESVIVEDRHRGSGVGRKMMEYAMNKAKDEKCYKLMLSSNKKRTQAHRFYENLGFQQHGLSFMVEVNGND